MKVYNVKVNGKLYEVEVEEVLAETKEKQEKEISKVEEPKKEEIEKAPSEKGIGSVTAPMPGKILDVKVSKGQTLKTGDVVLILEAMKMENEISAHVDGKVSGVYVTKGQSVNSGDVLLSIE